MEIYFFYKSHECWLCGSHANFFDLYLYPYYAKLIENEQVLNYNFKYLLSYFIIAELDLFFPLELIYYRRRLISTFAKGVLNMVECKAWLTESKVCEYSLSSLK